ncbi:MAG: RNA polymerase sigma factor [Armatimonadetes bacterium]|nr:RNA polymerase sigma factor [Armatimonadota bacterium]
MTAPRNPTDQDETLVRACLRGEPEAFHSLFERYREPVYRLAYRITGSADEAEDATQEIFVHLFERIGSFRFESAFSTWLYRMAVRQCLNRCRRHHEPASLDEAEAIPSAGEDDPVDLCLRREREEHALRAVAGLPESLKSVFVLVGVERMPYAEVAAILDLSVEAVRMRMSRARKELSARLIREGMAP